MAFASGKSDSPNAFVVANASDNEAAFDISLNGGGAKYKVYATSDTMNCQDLPDFCPINGKGKVILAKNTVATFIQQ
jgi:hypothetical protein